ncbi:2-oxoglutarate synthase [Patescibacteria group bacterium]|nr:2-oxoglutarate synthase [Patescibacteria group bacterium]MBU1722209.1 2-oxoglutarate synthase [Patescibacteria group bacterium]MBU1901160.1 2-oxoglutarate synthase [Patescibacteria group bacterium]
MSHAKSTFCPGCGQPMTLRALHQALKKQDLESKAVLGLDIGCSLLAWDFLPINTFQTHHGRVVATMNGFKRAKKDSISIAYAGDGGAYAIGLQSLLWAAMRDEPITVIVSNNVVYAMTGGQSAPTTMIGQKTSTNLDPVKQEPMRGPELIKQLNPHAYVARTSMTDMKELNHHMEQAIATQQAGHFSLVEVLSFCPTNWKVAGPDLKAYVENMKKIFPVGVCS